MNNLWDTWKKGFDVWEKKTAEVFETAMKNPKLLEPAGTMLSSAMKMKAASDQLMAQWWSAWGLPTRRDQERTLHQLNQLQSRILDLEEQLAEAKKD